jgi:hypothetical protein
MATSTTQLEKKMKHTYKELIEFAELKDVQCRYTFSCFYELKFKDGTIYDGNIDDCIKTILHKG